MKQHFTHFHGFIHSYSVPSSEIFCIKAVFVACSLCWYVCTDTESETAYEQATITALIQNISLGRGKGLEKRVFIMFSSLGRMQCILLQN